MPLVRIASILHAFLRLLAHLLFDLGILLLLLVVQKDFDLLIASFDNFVTPAPYTLSEIVYNVHKLQ